MRGQLWAKAEGNYMFGKKDFRSQIDQLKSREQENRDLFFNSFPYSKLDLGVRESAIVNLRLDKGINFNATSSVYLKKINYDRIKSVKDKIEKFYRKEIGILHLNLGYSSDTGEHYITFYFE